MSSVQQTRAAAIETQRLEAFNRESRTLDELMEDVG
jgi:hypothetical protein